MTDAMNAPVRIQRKRTKGFNLQAASPNGLPVVYVGRPSKWGNPFEVEEYGRLGALSMFYGWFFLKSPVEREQFIAPLRGKNLACWCKPGAVCHVDALLKLANLPEGET